MQTSPILNTTAPVQTQTTKANDASPSPDSPNSFNQVLSREMADRKAVNQAPKAKEPEAKATAKSPSSGNTQDTKAANASDTDTSTADASDSTDVQSDAAAATNDMLALVASLNQATSASQQTAAADAPAATAQAADIAIDAAGASSAAAKPGLDKLGTERSRIQSERTTDTTLLAKGQTAATAIATTAPTQAGQPEAKADRTPDFGRALDNANTPAETVDAVDVKPADMTATQANPAKELVTGTKEMATTASAKQDIAAAMETPVAPATLQVSQQAAVNNLTHLATAHASESLAPRVGTPAWDQALGQKVTWMIAGEQQSASLTLNPPDLGPLQVVLNVTNSQANATFVAAQPEVRQALEAAMPRLRDMLSDAGIQLGQATVSSGSNGQQNAFDQQQPSSNSRRPDISSVRFDTPVQTGRVQQSSSGQGLVDTFV